MDISETQLENEAICLKKKQEIGRTKLNYLFVPFWFVMMITPLFCYYRGVYVFPKLHPFPYVTITGVAMHQPQATIFRWLMGTGSSIHMIYFAMFKNFQVETASNKYLRKFYYWMFWLSMVSVVAEMLSICTLDTAGAGVFHFWTATLYLGWLDFLMFFMTLIAWFLRARSPKFISLKNLILKSIIAFPCGISSLIILVKAVIEVVTSDIPPYNHTIIVILEWGLLYAGILWLGTLFFDFSTLNIVLVKNQSGQKNSLQLEEANKRSPEVSVPMKAHPNDNIIGDDGIQ